MARHKSALTALKALEKSYEEERKALLRKAEEEISATVHKMVGGLANIAKDFPKVVSSAVATLVLPVSTPPAGKTATAAATTDAPAEGREAERFRAMGVKAHRTKLGLSAENYGKLVGVSGVTIYKWESGKNKPQQAQKAKWLAVRGLGKEEALRQLGTAAPKAAPAAPARAVKFAAAKPVAPKKQKLGTFKETAQEMILSLLKGKKGMTTSQLVTEWDKSGRGGAVAQTLGKMLKAKKLIRKPLGGKKGSEYSVA